MYKITLVTGDGVGPEIAEATKKCLDATGVKLDWDIQDCGIEVIEAEGEFLLAFSNRSKRTIVRSKPRLRHPSAKVSAASMSTFVRNWASMPVFVLASSTRESARTFLVVMSTLF